MKREDRKKLWSKFGANLRKELKLPHLKVSMSFQQMMKDQATIKIGYGPGSMDIYNSILTSFAFEEFKRSSDFLTYQKDYFKERTWDDKAVEALAIRVYFENGTE